MRICWKSQKLSTEASNRIEGIYTSDDRIQALVKEKSAPRNRSENEIAGYRDVLATIHENYDYIPLGRTSFSNSTATCISTATWASAVASKTPTT